MFDLLIRVIHVIMVMVIIMNGTNENGRPQGISYQVGGMNKNVISTPPVSTQVLMQL